MGAFWLGFVCGGGVVFVAEVLLVSWYAVKLADGVWR